MYNDCLDQSTPRISHYCYLHLDRQTTAMTAAKCSSLTKLMHRKSAAAPIFPALPDPILIIYVLIID